MIELLPVLEDWLQNSDLGAELIRLEQQVLDKELACLFGYHLLQLSVSPNFPLHQNSTINHKFSLSPIELRQDNETAVAGLSDFSALPLPDDSVDVVILHHVLEFSSNPHQLLKEATRVIIPKGHIIIVGFNHWSAFGFWRLFMRNMWTMPQLQYRHYSIRAGRLMDWLQLLEFDPVKITYGFYRPPFESLTMLKQFERMERIGTRLGWPFGGFYCVTARKDVVPLTPIRPAWLRTKRIVVPLNIAKPVTKVG